MKKSIALVLLLFGMINAEPSEFSIQQMITAIEGSDYGRVKDLMEHYQFQQDPELMNRFLICARDVFDERKGSLTYRDKCAFASGMCLGAGASSLLSRLHLAIFISRHVGRKAGAYEALPGLAGGLLGCLGVYLMKHGMNVQPKLKVVGESDTPQDLEQSNSLCRRDKLFWASGGLIGICFSLLNPVGLRYGAYSNCYFASFSLAGEPTIGGMLAGLLGAILGRKLSMLSKRINLIKK